MVNVLRPKTQLNYKDFTTHQCAADIKFIYSISKFLHEGLESALSDLYGDAGLSQILAGKHVRR